MMVLTILLHVDIINITIKMHVDIIYLAYVGGISMPPATWMRYIELDIYLSVFETIKHTNSKHTFNDIIHVGNFM